MTNFATNVIRTGLPSVASLIEYCKTSLIRMLILLVRFHENQCVLMKLGCKNCMKYLSLIR